MPKELIRVRDRFYILSTSGRIDDRTRVLKQGDTFAVFDRFGDIDSLRQRELGIYHKDTRFLSRLALRLGNQRPSLLSSTIREDNALMAVDLTNFDVRQGDQVVIPRGTIHIFRSKILWEATCYDRLYIHNYGRSKVDLPIVVEFDAVEAEFFVNGQFFGECDGGPNGGAERVGAFVDVPGAEGEAIVGLGSHGEKIRDCNGVGQECTTY